MRWAEGRVPDIWERLLDSHPRDWRTAVPESVATEDARVPRAVLRVLKKLDTGSVYDALHSVPLRHSKNFPSYVLNARHAIKEAVRRLWKECLARLRLKLPLLILDEAHHLKNAGTRLASLFRSEEARDDADEIARGPFAGVFERMLFLTATPFQLGHGELCSVLDRFDGISWAGTPAPPCGRDGFSKQREELRAALDAAQEAAVTLDHAWGRLQTEDLRVGDVAFAEVEQWWPEGRKGEGLTAAAADVVRCFERAKERMSLAERHLRPWVIRHLKPRRLPGTCIDRRKRLPGRCICLDAEEREQGGLPVSGEALVPFLLAARAASQTPESRPVFAEGLASSYEAFLHTRRNRLRGGPGAEVEVDADDDPPEAVEVTDEVSWYLDHLENLIPRAGVGGAEHPKVAATVGRVVDTWRRGEKVVVFCHYVLTGRILRQRISDAMQSEIRHLGATKLGCPVDEVGFRLDLIGKRFFDEDSPIRRACDAEALSIVSEFPALEGHREDLMDIIRRNVRTPAFLVRFFPLGRDRLDETAMSAALDSPDEFGLTLRMLLRQFMHFLQERCGTEDRRRYVEAVRTIQTGTHFGVEVAREYEEDELQGALPDSLLPQVRLVNGTTRPDTRQRLMLAFNTPFHPEVLVASSVMAEGIDLHLNCRHVVHHDLCWNPSTLEQRTGRVDRIGAKAEAAGRPIHVYLPFVAETQDEKMYRVVMDRERWFHVVMGEDYTVDVRTTETLASRIPLPASAASELSFRLEVDHHQGSSGEGAMDGPTDVGNYVYPAGN